jgi:hypothetical protein
MYPAFQVLLLLPGTESTPLEAQSECRILGMGRYTRNLNSENIDGRDPTSEVQAADF